MLTWADIIALRMERQYFMIPCEEGHYDDLFYHMSPVPTEYWCPPGNPPSLPMHIDFDDGFYNMRRRSRRELLKGRFAGGSISYVTMEDLEIFACLYKKELKQLTQTQEELLQLLTQEGPMNIGFMKELTGLLVKEITPALHRLQEAFLVFEDQADNEGDRSWYLFESEFPEVNLNRYSKVEALQLVLPRFAHLIVFFNERNLKSYYKLPGKLLSEAVAALLSKNVLISVIIDEKQGYMLTNDLRTDTLIQSENKAIKKDSNDIKKDRNEIKNDSSKFMKDNNDVQLKLYRNHIQASVILLQRNDFLVRASLEELKEKFTSSWDVLYYLLIDGTIRGAVVGKFKFGPHIIEDIVLDLPDQESKNRKEEIISAVYEVFDRDLSKVQRFQGNEI